MGWFGPRGDCGCCNGTTCWSCFPPVSFSVADSGLSPLPGDDYVTGGPLSINVKQSTILCCSDAGALQGTYAFTELEQTTGCNHQSFAPFSASLGLGGSIVSDSSSGCFSNPPSLPARGCFVSFGNSVLSGSNVLNYIALCGYEKLCFNPPGGADFNHFRQILVMTVAGVYVEFGQTGSVKWADAVINRRYTWWFHPTATCVFSSYNVDVVDTYRSEWAECEGIHGSQLSFIGRTRTFPTPSIPWQDFNTEAGTDVNRIVWGVAGDGTGVNRGFESPLCLPSVITISMP